MNTSAQKIVLATALIGGLLLIGYTSIAQSSFGINTNNPDSSAVLDVVSTNKGILIPRMDSASRAGIANPATGLLVYDNTANKFYYYTGAAWTIVGDANSMWSKSGTYVFNTSDNIGIGNATPSFKLDVTDDINRSSTKGY